MELYCLLLSLMASALLQEVSGVLNVTVVPWPVVTVSEGSNVTLRCRVIGRWRSGAGQEEAESEAEPGSLPVVRWMFVPEHGGDETLVAKVNLRRAKFYGNYTKSFSAPKLRLKVLQQGTVYELMLVSANANDRGTYVCRAQEFTRHRERWRQTAHNSSAATQLRVKVRPRSGCKINLVEEDVYLCAVLICSVGLVCVCLFTTVVCCQYLQRKRRRKENYHLVRSPQSSSGETVLSIISPSPALPKKERKYKSRKHTHTHPDTPPEIPAKAPIGEKIRKPKLIKALPTNLLLPIVEESLTYAELELVKQATPTIQATPTKPTSPTVYAQILFTDEPV
ncbi:V-set and transmembrane domain-containing protein 4 [Engraulis encrasicolus]|uniref:V-set and transmembrane domain-containing protein 4 n=1 Tax=Engraulis encrasicolus TaxID=184585 RepID=UPI002FD3F6BA